MDWRSPPFPKPVPRLGSGSQGFPVKFGGVPLLQGHRASKRCGG